MSWRPTAPEPRKIRLRPCRSDGNAMSGTRFDLRIAEPGNQWFGAPGEIRTPDHWFVAGHSVQPGYGRAGRRDCRGSAAQGRARALSTSGALPTVSQGRFPLPVLVTRKGLQGRADGIERAEGGGGHGRCAARRPPSDHAAFMVPLLGPKHGAARSGQGGWRCSAPTLPEDFRYPFLAAPPSLGPSRRPPRHPAFSGLPVVAGSTHLPPGGKGERVCCPTDVAFGSPTSRSGLPGRRRQHSPPARWER